ncbi:MAG: hypothetical protein JRJ85_19290, partial [Deltaproteobacteria bacterium]|nr:hypothetical protein [Deltaproteobacteria bacterium]
TGDQRPEQCHDFSKPTDIEITMQLLKFMDDFRECARDHDLPDGNNMISFMVNNALASMTNPMAKKLLLDEIAGQ